MIDYLAAAALAGVILATVAVMLLAFPGAALIVIPVAIGLMLPLLIVLGPLFLWVVVLPIGLVRGLIVDWQNWRAAHPRKPKPEPDPWAEPPLLTLGDLFGRD